MEQYPITQPPVKPNAAIYLVPLGIGVAVIVGVILVWKALAAVLAPWMIFVLLLVLLLPVGMLVKQ